MQQISIKEVQIQARPGAKGDQLGIVQENETWPNYQMVYGQNRISPWEWGTYIFLDFEILTDCLIPARRPDQELIFKERERENLTSDGFCHSGEPQKKNKRKRIDRQILGPNKRI